MARTQKRLSTAQSKALARGRKIVTAKRERARAAGKTPKYIRNTGSAWGSADMRQLKTLVKENTPTRVIGLKLGRSEASIRDKAKKEGLSLKPVNRSPNKGRRTSRR